jgi:hypothetical protein
MGVTKSLEALGGSPLGVNGSMKMLPHPLQIARLVNKTASRLRLAARPPCSNKPPSFQGEANMLSISSF